MCTKMKNHLLHSHHLYPPFTPGFCLTKIPFDKSKKSTRKKVKQFTPKNRFCNNPIASVASPCKTKSLQYQNTNKSNSLKKIPPSQSHCNCHQRFAMIKNLINSINCKLQKCTIRGGGELPPPPHAATASAYAPGIDGLPLARCPRPQPHPATYKPLRWTTRMSGSGYMAYPLTPGSLSRRSLIIRTVVKW